MTCTINGTTGVTFPDASVQNTAATGFGFKNRIINGAMMIDQRNAGASVTPSSGGTYTLDRWRFYGSAASKASVQQNAGSVTPPAGYTNYLGVTSLSSYSISSTDQFLIDQFIEGYNVADLGWGAAGAATVTFSFWVRSSLTGTFGGSFNNASNDRSYPFSYTISAANTWEQKTITVAGDTTGTWLKTNGRGISIRFGLGVGSTNSGTASAWTTGEILSVTGATSVVGTSGATFYVTGVQLEKGSTATSFDYRPYGTELALCQRYYYKKQGAAYTFSGYAANTVAFRASGNFPVTMRTPATALEQSGTASHYTVVGGGQSSAVCSAVPTFLTADVDNWQITATVASGLVAYNSGVVNINSSGYLAWSAEL